MKSSDKRFLGFHSHLEDQEVPSLDQNAKFFQLFTVFRQAHHLAVDTVLRGGTYCTRHKHIERR